MNDQTLEERVPARKYPYGFTSHRLEMIRAGHDPTPTPSGLAAGGPTRRDVLHDLIRVAAPVGQAMIVGRAVLIEAIGDWLDQPA